ncbi:MAG TPA: DUF3300 domain-containing protein [Steroidobacteraceae bacterium]|nr:DUF3300 domain-containing protein [Steroidobacteraceae bacterium]
MLLRLQAGAVLVAGLALVLIVATGASLAGARAVQPSEPLRLAQDQPPPPPPDQPPPPADQGEEGAPPPYALQTPQQLQQLVAPIALYPDPLVAQVLAASTFPEQVVEADRFVQGNPSLTGQALAQAVDSQPWDASVKALTAFPVVLGNMDKNLSWTSALGDAYYNQPQDVMNAVQAMRQQAQAAGNLQSTPQQVVTTQGSAIDIEPASPDMVFVPAYDPWAVYGAPIEPWPDWYPYPGIWFAGPYLSFGIGFPIGFYGGYGWDWHHWGFNWPGREVIFNHGRYVSHSTTFFNRNQAFGARGVPGARGGFGAGGTFGRGAPARPGGFGPGMAPRPFNGNAQAARGYAEPRGQIGTRSGAFSGYSRGAEERGFAARGAASFGGGARGGGGPRGGGGGRGGRP